MVRSKIGWNGLDYLEVSLDQPPAKGAILSVYFLGKLPPEFTGTNLVQYLQLDGGRRIKDIRIVKVEAVSFPDNPEKDDFLRVRLDKSGDLSTYTLSLVDVANVDRHYDHLDFSFKLDCPSDLDCTPSCVCKPPAFTEPEINYLAKDYGSFRQLILDRLAVLVPSWTERHIPDIGITLVELLAYVGDYLSYYQDAVATEAYLETARQRISVRRHVRLVDYVLHEGCNSRAWLSVHVTSDYELPSTNLAFLTGLNDAGQSILNWNDLRQVPFSSYEVFEPLPSHPARQLKFYQNRNEIKFYTWGEQECCLPQGSTSATLLDYRQTSVEASDSLAVGDVLIFEEVIGPKTGLPEDANPLRRHVVRLTKITPGVDPIILTQEGKPTPYLEIEWAKEDVLPFPFCISAIGQPPDCCYIENISIARGNMVLVDLGRIVDLEYLGEVPALATQPICKGEGHVVEISHIPGRFRPRLSKMPLTFSVPLMTGVHGRGSCHLPKKTVQTPQQTSPCAQAAWSSTPEEHPSIGLSPKISASQCLLQDKRAALPNLRVYSLAAKWRTLFDQPNFNSISIIDDESEAWLQFPTNQLSDPLAQLFQDGRLPAIRWDVQYDLLKSERDDHHCVVEIDNDGIAYIRFGDGVLGAQPEAGAVFFARYRYGNGPVGNVGADSIIHAVMKNNVNETAITVRNPLPAVGGIAPEPLAEAKLYAPAPTTFRKRIERAITAEDYAVLAERDARLQRAAAELVWTGSWYEADVAVDPLGTAIADSALLQSVKEELYPFRRMGHDLRVRPACYVPIELQMEVCVHPHYQKGHVKAALLDVFSNRKQPDGRLGFFHPDNLSFGDSVEISKLIAAGIKVTGVQCIRVSKLQRLFEADCDALSKGLLVLFSHEIAQLDNDPVYPERGKLELILKGGR